MAANDTSKIEADVIDTIEAVVSYAHREGHAALGFLHKGAFFSALEIPLSFIEHRAKVAPVTTAAPVAAAPVTPAPATPPAAT